MLAGTMPPNYRQQQGAPLASAERRGAIWLVAVVLLSAVGIGAWEATNGFGSDHQPKDCVSVTVGGPTGGGYLSQCGKAAVHWCLTEPHAGGPVARLVGAACRKDGYSTGPSALAGPDEKFLRLA